MNGINLHGSMTGAPSIIGLTEKTCPECGKRFYAGSDWTYKFHNQEKNSNTYFCRWSCYRRAQARKEAAERARQAKDRRRNRTP